MSDTKYIDNMASKDNVAVGKMADRQEIARDSSIN